MVAKAGDGREEDPDEREQEGGDEAAHRGGGLNRDQLCEH